MRARWTWIGALTSAVLTVFVACDGGEGDGETTGGPLSFEEDIQPLINRNCLCHIADGNGEMEADFMTLNPGVSFGNLVGVPSEEVPTMNRIEAGTPEESYLWHKINDTHISVGGEGDFMPPLGLLPQADRDTIESWILQGAPA